MEPAKKSEKVNKDLKTIFDVDREQDINKNQCVFCKKQFNKTEFRDLLSLKEFKISGLCQECQDKVFCPKDEDL